ncbi:methyltransferase domain-containing protein [Streptomyces buecherae]|uniref:methyltransferase domain-containing protein n=1 Tax=Streptomyces buecherae TaxID=2763006 RepID=UPI00365C1550
MSTTTAAYVQECGGGNPPSPAGQPAPGCRTAPPPPHVAAALRRVHGEVVDRFHGRGSPIPAALAGATVLDLGCGSGRDAYVLAQLTGPTGRVIGVDVAEDQLEVARRHLGHHAERFGYANVDFRNGYLEDLSTAGIADGSVDVVVANRVVNLSPCKPRMFEEIFRVLRPGGELHFCEIFADRRIPASLMEDPELLGECLSGALYERDFRRLMARSGCADVRVIDRCPAPVSHPEIARKIGYVNFSALTVRAFKLPLEDGCEDYGQTAVYRGTLEGHPHAFDLDDRHRFATGRPTPVCGNTADMLGRTRFAAHFDVTGDKTVHRGAFAPCPSTVPEPGGAPGGGGGEPDGAGGTGEPDGADGAGGTGEAEAPR